MNDRRLGMAMGNAQISLGHDQGQVMGRGHCDPRCGGRQPIGQDRRRAAGIAPLQQPDQLEQPGLILPEIGAAQAADIEAAPRRGGHDLEERVEGRDPVGVDAARTKSGRQSGWLPVGSR